MAPGGGLGLPVLDAGGDGGDGGETVALVQPQVAAVLGDGPPSGPGKLYDASHLELSVRIRDETVGAVPVEGPGSKYLTRGRRLVWLSDEDLQEGYAVDFVSLTMHAISRDTDAYPHPCIYMQIQGREDDDEDHVGINGDEEAEGDPMAAEAAPVEDLSAVKEMRLVPNDPSTLDRIFQVLCECAALNPDPVVEQEGEGEWFFNSDEVLAPGAVTHNGGHGLDELDISTEQFEDADEDEVDDEPEDERP
eukprot:SM000001S04617  [mRNA]  locus=s1:1251635:1253809:- [translate_table: standard]